MTKRRVFTWTCGDTFVVRKKPGDPTRIQYRTPAEDWADDKQGWRSGGTLATLERFLAGKAPYGYCLNHYGPAHHYGPVRRTPNGGCMAMAWDARQKIETLTAVYRYARRIR